MTWQPLGIVDLSYDWQFLAVPVLKFGLFRITQLYSDSDYVHGKIVIGQAFNEPKQFYNYRAIYPSKSQKLIKLTTPVEIVRDEDIYNRFLAVKLDSRYYRYSIGWRVQFEVQDTVGLTLDQIRSLELENREGIALLQQQLDRIEQGMNSTTGQ